METIFIIYITFTFFLFTKSGMYDKIILLISLREQAFFRVNKMRNKKIILFTAIIPLGAASFFTLTACLLRMFYFDLPTFMAQAWSFFYSASFFVMDFAFYFAMGIFAMLLMFAGKKQIILSSLLMAVVYPITPFLQFLIRHLTVSHKLDAEEMQDYFMTDMTTFTVNLLCVGLLAVIALVIKVIFLRDKCDIKASVLPKTPALCIYTAYFAVMIVSVFANFIIGGAYIQELGKTCLNSLIYVAGYFVAFGGAALAAHDLRRQAE